MGRSPLYLFILFGGGRMEVDCGSSGSDDGDASRTVHALKRIIKAVKTAVESPESGGGSIERDVDDIIFRQQEAVDLFFSSASAEIAFQDAIYRETYKAELAQLPLGVQILGSGGRREPHFCAVCSKVLPEASEHARLTFSGVAYHKNTFRQCKTAADLFFRLMVPRCYVPAGRAMDPPQVFWAHKECERRVAVLFLNLHVIHELIKEAPRYKSATREAEAWYAAMK